MQNQAFKLSLKTNFLKNLSNINFNEHTSDLSLFRTGHGHNTGYFYSLPSIKLQSKANLNSSLNFLSNYNQFKEEFELNNSTSLSICNNWLIQLYERFLESLSDDLCDRQPTEEELLELDAWEFSTDESEFKITSFEKSEQQFSLPNKYKPWEESWTEFEEKVKVKIEPENSSIASDKKNKFSAKNDTFFSKITSPNNIGYIINTLKKKKKEIKIIKVEELKPNSKINRFKLSKEEQLEKRKEDRHNKKNNRDIRRINKTIKETFEEIINFEQSDKLITEKDGKIAKFKFEFEIEINKKVVGHLENKKRNLYIYKSYYYSKAKISSQKDWMIVRLIKDNQEKLISLLQKGERELFKQEIFNIWRNVCLHYDKKGFNLTPSNTLWTNKKKVINSKWTNSEHKEEKDQAFLMKAWKQFGIKSGEIVVLDFDFKNQKLGIIKKAKQTIMAFLKKNKIPFYADTQSGGIHVYVRCLETMRSTRLYFKYKDNKGKWKAVHIGDFLAHGKQFISPLSENRKINWDSKTAYCEFLLEYKTSEDLIESLSDVLPDSYFFLGNTSSSKKTSESSSTNGDINGIDKRTEEQKKKYSAIGSYEERDVRNVKIIIPEVEELAKIPCNFEDDISRSKPRIVWLSFQYQNGKTVRFMIDTVRRKKHYQEIIRGAREGRTFNILISELTNKGYWFFKGFLDHKLSTKTDEKNNISTNNNQTKKVEEIGNFSNQRFESLEKLPSERLENFSKSKLGLEDKNLSKQSFKSKKNTPHWTYSKNQRNLRKDEEFNGKHIIYSSWNKVDNVWKIIVNGMKNNLLSTAEVKVSNRIDENKNPNASIIIYTYKDNIDSIRKEIKELGIENHLCYKLEESTDKNLTGHASHEFCEFKKWKKFWKVKKER